MREAVLIGLSKLTDYEYDLLSAIEGSLSDNLRHIVWDASSLIKAGKLNRIPGCRRRTEREKNKSWIAYNKDRTKGSTLTHLVDAKETAKEAAVEASDERYEQVGIYADNLRWEMGNQEFNAYFADDFTGRIDMQQVMDHMQMDANIREQEELQAIYKITDREEGIKALAIHYALMFEEDVADCMEQATEEWDEEHAEVDEDDLDDEWTEGLFNSIKPEPLGDTVISVYRSDC